MSVADLDKVSVKNIRRALQELFVVDLEPHKAHINEVIVNRYNRLVEEKDNKSELERRKEIERKDAILARKLQKEHGIGLRKKPRVPSKKRTLDTEAKPNPLKQIMFMASDTLRDIIGIDKTSRPQVVKLLWAYIKENKLQDPNDGRIILCDESLERLFKKKTVTAFLMNKYLSDHLTREDESMVQKSSNGDQPKPSVKSEDQVPDSESESEAE